MREDAISLNSVDDDTLILIFGNLFVPEILCLRQTSKRLAGISRLRIVWRNACVSDVLPRGYPFSSQPLNDLPDLESAARSAYRLGEKWASPSPAPRYTRSFVANPSTHIELVRFVPCRDWLITVSKGIWSVIIAWDIKGDSDVRKIAEWSPKGVLFNGAVVVNTDPSSDAIAAVLVPTSSGSILNILNLRIQDGRTDFVVIASWPSSMRPVTLKGDLLASSDDMTRTEVKNWKTRDSAILSAPANSGDTAWQLDRCIQVVFTFESVLVIRARSVYLFPALQLGSSTLPHLPIARHSFGWIDGVSVSMAPHPDAIDNSICHAPIYILLRAESDDPWAQEEHNLRFFTIAPNPHYRSRDCESEADKESSELKTSPYIFPPCLTAEVFSSHGSLRCADITLRPYGTAVWVHPRNRAVRGLVASDVHLQQIPVPDLPASNERLLAAVFPGPLNRSGLLKVEAKTLGTNENNDWTCLDYDEAPIGRIALGASSGTVTILEM